MATYDITSRRPAAAATGAPTAAVHVVHHDADVLRLLLLRLLLPPPLASSSSSSSSDVVVPLQRVEPTTGVLLILERQIADLTQRGGVRAEGKKEEKELVGSMWYILKEEILFISLKRGSLFPMNERLKGRGRGERELSSVSLCTDCHNFKFSDSSPSLLLFLFSLSLPRRPTIDSFFL